MEFSPNSNFLFVVAALVIWTWTAVVVIMCVPIAVCVYYNCWPGITPVLKGLLGVAPIFWTVGTIEVITFTPMFLPALFGGLGVVYISKNWKVAVAPVCFMVILFLLVPSLAGSVGVLVPVGALISIAVARILYKKGMV